jgi:hypothetical protein
MEMISLYYIILMLYLCHEYCLRYIAEARIEIENNES